MSRFLLLISLLTLLLVGAAGYCMIRVNQLDTHFETIEKGMSQQDVLNIMGAPSWAGDCGRRLSMRASAFCTKEFGYAKPLARWEPDYLVISFAADGTVIEAVHITSP